jgi:hypothetical protein
VAYILHSKVSHFPKSKLFCHKLFQEQAIFHKLPLELVKCLDKELDLLLLSDDKESTPAAPSNVTSIIFSSVKELTF